tara:strand:- start:374 stop:1153 length:780 start_codon:yes stop_codon:yes gene_type:complete
LNPFRQLKRLLIYKLRKKVNIDILFENFDKLSLDEIFAYFGSDKANISKSGKASKTVNPKKVTGHGYSKYYEKHLNIFKNKNIKILEIGSYSGASAASFVKYFPYSEIYCLDINLTNFNITSKNIKVFGIDVSKKAMVNNFFRRINTTKNSNFFDIIIDDGSHKLSDMLKAINIFYKTLKPNGFYILEDYKFPNYYEHLDDCSEIKMDEFIQNIKTKKVFQSNILDKESVNYLINNTLEVYSYKGLLNHSDIAFMKKSN